MKASVKTAWLIGALENISIEDDLASKGYEVKKFQSEKTMFGSGYDDHPDMIVFSEESLQEGSLFFKIDEYFPGTLAVAIGCGEQQRTSNEGSADSVDRLIKSLRNITKA